ncbi:hypothetical protein Neosp_013672 [[Neocosmospora] mangrovei]
MSRGAGKKYTAEHIYEAQYLGRFFKWLLDGDLPVGYENPDHKWIDEVLFGLGGSTRTFVGSGWTLKDDMWNELSICLGSTEQPGRLALADKGTAGVFYYMRRPEIWAKFVETSQAIEEIFDDFDLEYEWDKNNPMNDGQLKRPTDRVADQPMPGLRDLYCYWIDMTLAQMEDKAAKWLTAATDKFKAQFGDSLDVPQGKG